jgi:1,4-alpha-glucan branching enzyme
MSRLVLALHGHLPYVHHPEHEHFLEEDWLFEAVADCYVPLLWMLDGWRRDGVDAQITLGLSPTLLSMLDTPLLRARTRRHIDGRLSLAQRRLQSGSGDDPFRPALVAAVAHAEAVLSRLDDASDNLPRAFAEHHDGGRVELMTCGATHGVAPVLLDGPSIEAQVTLAVRTHERILGVTPRGMWLPECGVHPDVLEAIARAGMLFTFTEDRAVQLAWPPPACGVHRPVWTPSGVALFPRDPDSAKEVWSATDGYPGDFRYREFYRDLGYDADDHHLDAIHKQGTGARKNVGVKLHRITGARLPLGDKQPYSPHAAAEAARGHAADFVAQRRADAAHIGASLGRAPCITAAFDAELFGHWWHEGPQFLDHVLRALAAGDGPKPVGAHRYLAEDCSHQVVHPAVSSWGDGGAFQVWVNGDNDWLWQPIHDARLRLQAAVVQHGGAWSSSPLGRALRQATREVMLSQSSDWPFIITMGTQLGYAVRRPIEHLARAHRLLAGLEHGSVDEADLSQQEERDAAFPDVDPHWFGR